MVQDLRKILGKSGEELALKYLQDKGLRLIGKNLRLFCGEIDLLMADGEALVIVEVKTKTNLSFGLPSEMINYRKKRKLLQLAKALSQQDPDKSLRIDVVAIDKEKDTIEHIISAVEE